LLCVLEVESNIEMYKTKLIINVSNIIDAINLKSNIISTYSKTEVDNLKSSHVPDYSNIRSPIVMQKFKR
jgi:hypothetical protein